MFEKPAIKFSHLYSKLKNMNGGYILTAVLLDVINVKLENTSKEFLKYDTDDGKFILPKTGDYLMLIFNKGTEEVPLLFTTLRKAKDERANYYRNNIGKEFRIEYTEM